VLIAAAALLRAYPLLLVGYFLMRRKWRALAFATAGVAAGGLATVVVLGLAQTLSFVHGALWVTDYSVVQRVDDLALGPFVSRMFWALTATAPGSSTDWMRRAAIAIADVAVLGLTIRATLAEPNLRNRDPDWRIYSLWIATAIMLTPVGWHHYLVLLTIPFVQIVASAADERSKSRAVWMAAFCYILIAVSNRVFNRLLIPPLTEFQLIFPWMARALEETSFIALLSGFIASYWFATDRPSRVSVIRPTFVPAQPDPDPIATI
jgi:hypothetical protein